MYIVFRHDQDSVETASKILKICIRHEPLTMKNSLARNFKIRMQNAPTIILKYVYSVITIL